MKTTNTNNPLNRTARVAGLAYVLIVIIPLIPMIFIDTRITEKDDAVATINNIIANELLFRIDTAITLLMFIGVVILAVALYRILKPVNKFLAELALFWRFAEALVGMVAVLGSYFALSLITGGQHLEIMGPGQFYALADLALGFYWKVTPVIFILLALGSILVFSLFLKSGLIPKALSIWGIASYSLVLAGAMISLLFDGNAYMILGSQTILFEILIGGWLYFKGLSSS